MPALRKDKGLSLAAIHHRLNRIFRVHSAKHRSRRTDHTRPSTASPLCSDLLNVRAAEAVANGQSAANLVH
ncbi:MAG TPA: hypothetical protein VIH58_06900 [Chthoniobacterales bacterium]